MSRRILLIVLLLLSFQVMAYSQDTRELLGEVSKIYSQSESSAGGSGLAGSFSLWGMLGGLLFGGIGFVAFIYGKKNVEYKPLFIGIALMAYPYFFRGTIAIYAIGICLVAALFFPRN